MPEEVNELLLIFGCRPVADGKNAVPPEQGISVPAKAGEQFRQSARRRDIRPELVLHVVTLQLVFGEKLGGMCTHAGGDTPRPHASRALITLSPLQLCTARWCPGSLTACQVEDDDLVHPR